MDRTPLTQKQKDFIIKNYKTMSRKDMCDKTGLGYTRISTFMKQNNLKVSKEQSRLFAIKKVTGRTNFTKEEDLFITNYYLELPVKTLAHKLNRSGIGVLGRLKALGLVIPQEIIEQRKKDSRITKGTIPPNKGKKQVEYMSPEAIERTKATRFKKGQKSHNDVFDIGDISIRGDHTYRNNRRVQWIKLSRTKWQELHVYNWEQKYGPVPKGHCLWFKDGNSLNADVENLELISRRENVKRNSGHHLPSELKETIKLKNKLKRILIQKSKS